MQDPKKHKLIHLAILLAMALVIVAERVHTFDEPIETDIAGYAVIAHEMRTGRLLYSDLWERKPPLLYGTFGLAERLAGYGQGEIFWVNTVVAILTLICVYSAAAGGGPIAGLLAAGLWTALCFDLPTEANQPNGEVFVNLCLTGAFALLARWPGRQGVAIGRSLMLGSLLALATLYKQHAAACCCWLLLGHVLIRFDDGESVWKQACRRAVEAGLAGLLIGLAWLSVLIYFIATGRRAAFLDALVGQNLIYARSPAANLLLGLQWSHLAPEFMGWAIGPVALLLSWMMLSHGKRKNPGERSALRDWGLWGCWAIGAWMVVELPGWPYPHYYQMWIPVLSVGAGWAAAGLLRPNRRAPALARYAVLMAALGYVACRQAAPFWLPPHSWSALKYPDEDFNEQVRLGHFLAGTIPANQRFWNFGQENTLYFSAQRSPPTGVLYLDPMLIGREVETYRQRLLADLQRSPPRMLVLTRRWSAQLQRIRRTDPLLRNWIEQHYTPLPPNPDFPDFELWKLKSAPA